MILCRILLCAQSLIACKDYLMHFFNKIFRDLISLSIVLCLFIILAQNTILTLRARLPREMNFCEFLGTFRYAANGFYLKICFTDYSSYIKR